MKFMFSLLLLAMSGTLMAQMSNPAPNAGAPSHISPRNDLSGTAISACGSITSPGNYYLSRDLSCPGTGLFISGPGIDLDLNGHTITYGTAGGAMGAVYGIEHNACWDVSHRARTVPCELKNTGIGANIYGGTIVQSNRAPAFSHALFFGQDLRDNQTINIHDVTVTIQQPGTKGFHSVGQSGQIILEHNTIYDNVKTINYPGQADISARSAFQGQAIFIYSGTMQIPNRIDNNKIVGSPQGGIRDTSIGATIYQNDISQTSTYTNDFCVDVPGSGQQIYSNYCHPLNGRGIHVNGEGSQIYNNLLVVTEAPVNAEYHGCEIDGAYGIQLEQDIQSAGNVRVTGNQATLNTGACGGSDLRITSWPSGASAMVRDNTWIVNKTAGIDRFGGVPYSLEHDDLSSVVFGGDTLKTNDITCAGIDWDGTKNFTASLASCNAPYAVVALAGNGGTSTFKVTGAPNVNYACSPQAQITGTINGQAVKCPR